MHRLQELVRLHRMRTKAREVARLLGMGPNTERRFREVLEEAGLLEGSPEELPELGVLRQAVLERLPPLTPQQQTSTAQSWLEEITTMLERGAEPQAIYDALRLEHKDFTASLWAVKRLCRRLKRSREVKPEEIAITVETEPGQEAQVDFGYAGYLYDPQAGVPRKAWVFVMTLGYSRHQFSRIVFNQRVETWLDLHVEAFAALGGVPAVIVPDNLKAAVIRAAFGLAEDPALNRSYRELARHYGFKIDPTPPRDPRKKGKVEAGVKYLKRNFLRPRVFEDIEAANRELDRWVLEIAGRRRHGTTGWRPLEVFLTEEQPALLPLPARPFEAVVWKQAKVHDDGQIVFDGRLYPVPWRLKGKQVWVRATARTVAIYFEEERRATHERGKPVPKHIRDSFLPEERAPYRHRSRRYWEERADHIGPEVGSYIREVFDADDVLSTLRAVQAIVTHVEKFPPERARAACERARHFGNHTYVAVRDILRKGLDLEPLPESPAPTVEAAPAPRYARSAQELFHFALEERHEPN